MPAEDRIRQLGLQLPPAPAPAASYVTFVQVGNVAYTSGHIPVRPDGSRITGKVGAGLTTEQGAEAARVVGLGLLATIRANLGSLDRVARVVKVVGMVNAGPSFTEHSRVINGCSDLLVEVFGEAGRHVRSAVGMGSLPFDVAVEIEVVVEVSDRSPA
ncbi:MAG: RidA family protein [SAR202 cluster bacterium]|nr:RidA family protein [SAR202 cluster bacterium]